MGKYFWEGFSDVASNVEDTTQNVQIASINRLGLTFIRAIITLQLTHHHSIDNAANIPAWAPTVVGVDWRGKFGITSHRALFDGGDDWSLWRGLNWTVDFTAEGTAVFDTWYRQDPQNDFINVEGERDLDPYVDPTAVLWLSVGYGPVGVPGAPWTPRPFLKAFSARMLFLDRFA